MHTPPWNQPIDYLTALKHLIKSLVHMPPSNKQRSDAFLSIHAHIVHTYDSWQGEVILFRCCECAEQLVSEAAAKEEEEVGKIN